MANLLGGKITVQSDYGVGSKFSFLLPSITDKIEINQTFKSKQEVQVPLSEEGSSFDEV